MRVALFQLFMALCVSQLTWASLVVVDFSRSHSVDDLKRSGLALKEIAGGAGERDLVFEKQDVKILLPGGRSIQQRVELGIVDTKDGLLARLSMTGGVMPQEQAFQVAKSFVRSFELPAKKLLEWNERNQNKQFSSDQFSASPSLAFYPIVGLSVDSSMNKLYPWVVRFEIEWGWREQRDWNEERVWRELPQPAVAEISLNPPSGQTYERKDAFKETLEEQAGFEKVLTAKGQTATPAIPASPSSGRSEPESPSAVQLETPKSFSWLWLIGGVFLLVAAGGILFEFLRK
jgi:hypothetical protein